MRWSQSRLMSHVITPSSWTKINHFFTSLTTQSYLKQPCSCEGFLSLFKENFHLQLQYCFSRIFVFFDFVFVWSNIFFDHLPCYTFWYEKNCHHKFIDYSPKAVTSFRDALHCSTQNVAELICGYLSNLFMYAVTVRCITTAWKKLIVIHEMCA